MVVQSGKSGPHKIGPRRNPGLLDVFSMDPKVHLGKVLENMLKISMDRKEKIKSPSQGKMVSNF